MYIPYRDRHQAGRILATKLSGYAGADTIVLGLPRGGVPVAYEVAAALGSPLDVFIVRKLGVPDYPELAMGAIASGGVVTLNEDVIHAYNIDKDVIDRIAEREQREIIRKEKLYRIDRMPLNVRDRTVIVVDDGLATGASMRAAINALKKLDAFRIIAAVPVAPPGVCSDMVTMADAVVCVETPSSFQAVGQWYFDFTQTSDKEVRELLEKGRTFGLESQNQ